MHCKICDFSNTVSSDYYSSLYDTGPAGNTVIHDEKTGEYVCNYCLDEAIDAFQELQAAEEDEQQAILCAELVAYQAELEALEDDQAEEVEKHYV